MNLRCDLVTAAGWHDSIGDLACTMVTANELGARGIAVTQQDCPRPFLPAVIGPGALLVGDGGRSGVWWKALEPYHQPGWHLLNAVSANGPGDYSFLRDFIAVSVRDERSAEWVAPYTQAEPMVVPCPTVLLPPPDLEYYTNLPNMGKLRTLRERGPFILVDRTILGLVAGKTTVQINTRPWSGGVEADFHHRNPNVLAAYCMAAELVVASTLHLSIIAMAVGTPFLIWEQANTKCQAYWERAGFPEVCRKGFGELTDPDVIKEVTNKLPRVRHEEQKKAKLHMDILAYLIGDHPGGVK
jgi:hypothetical protein